MYRTRKTEKRYALQRKQAKAAGICCDFCEFTSTHPQVKEEFSHFWLNGPKGIVVAVEPTTAFYAKASSFRIFGLLGIIFPIAYGMAAMLLIM